MIQVNEEGYTEKFTIGTQTPKLFLETNIKQLGGELIDTDAQNKQKRKEAVRYRYKWCGNHNTRSITSHEEKLLDRASDRSEIKQPAKRGG